MKTVWIVSWRGVDEQCSCVMDALDRWDQLDARGIEAEVFEIAAGRRTRIA